MSLAEAARPAALRRKPLLRARAAELRCDFAAFVARRSRASVGAAAAFKRDGRYGETYFAAFALRWDRRNVRGAHRDAADAGGGLAATGQPWFFAAGRGRIEVGRALREPAAAALLVMPLAAWFIGRAAASWVFVAASLVLGASQRARRRGTRGIEEIVPKRCGEFFRVAVADQPGLHARRFVVAASRCNGQGPRLVLAAFVGISL